MPKVQAHPRRIAFASAIGAVLLIGGIVVVRWMSLDGTPASATPAATPSQPVATTPASDSLLDTLPITIAAASRMDSLAKQASAAAKDSARKTVKPAAKAPASKAKTTPAPPVTAPAPASNAATVKTDEFAPSLNQLVEAIQSKDLAVVEDAFPNMSANQHRAFEQLFDRAKTSALRIKVEKSTPQVVDGRATAKVTLIVTYNDPNSLAPTGAPYAYDAAWEARGGSWKLTELKSILPESR